MKKGEIILSLVALVCTVVGAFAMKSIKFTGGMHLFTTVVNGAGKCEAADCYTLASHLQQRSCPASVTYWTKNCLKSIPRSLTTTSN